MTSRLFIVPRVRSLQRLHWLNHRRSCFLSLPLSLQSTWPAHTCSAAYGQLCVPGLVVLGAGVGRVGTACRCGVSEVADTGHMGDKK